MGFQENIVCLSCCKCHSDRCKCGDVSPGLPTGSWSQRSQTTTW